VDRLREIGSIAEKARRDHARRPRRNQSPAFKAKVALAANNGEKTLITMR